MKSDLGYIGIINPDSAAADVVETAEQVDDGGFAGTGRAYNGKGLAGHGGEAYIIQSFIAFLVGEGYMIKGNLSCDGRHFHGVRLIFYGNGLVNGFKNTFQVGNRSQQGIVKVCQRGDR